MSANSRAVRRRCTATLLLMTLQGTACLAWHTEGVAPQVVLATQQPRALRVMRTDGRQLVLQHPVLRGDTLVGISDQQERSEEHTSELQSRLHLVCRLLLEKKKQSRLAAVEDQLRSSHGR